MFNKELCFYLLFQYVENNENLTATVIRALTIANDVDVVSYNYIPLQLLNTSNNYYIHYSTSVVSATQYQGCFSGGHHMGQWG